MANKRIYSPNSRITKLRHACNLNTEFYAKKSYADGCIFITSANNTPVGYMYYDTDSNTSSGFIFVTRYDYSKQVQKFKSYFSACTRIFSVKTQFDWTYYRVDAMRILHADNTRRTEEEV